MHDDVPEPLAQSMSGRREAPVRIVQGVHREGVDARSRAELLFAPEFLPEGP